MPGWFLSVWRPLCPGVDIPTDCSGLHRHQRAAHSLSLTLAAVSTACWHSQHDDGDNSLKVAP